MDHEEMQLIVEKLVAQAVAGQLPDDIAFQLRSAFLAHNARHGLDHPPHLPEGAHNYPVIFVDNKTGDNILRAELLQIGEVEWRDKNGVVIDDAVDMSILLAVQQIAKNEGLATSVMVSVTCSAIRAWEKDRGKKT